MSLSQDEQKEVKIMEEMFATEGWRRIFMEECFTLLESQKERLITGDLTAEQMYFLKGGIEVLQSFVDYEVNFGKLVEMRKTENEAMEAENDAAAAL